RHRPVRESGKAPRTGGGAQSRRGGHCSECLSDHLQGRGVQLRGGGRYHVSSGQRRIAVPVRDHPPGGFDDGYEGENIVALEVTLHDEVDETAREEAIAVAVRT